MSTQQTAKTQYITLPSGPKIAYRHFGHQPSIPLVMHIHYRANMDFWDPLLINNLASHRSILLFDQAGTGRSTGEVPLKYQGWADTLIALVHALGFSQIDLLGFSMGGKAVQMVALSAPNLVRKLILAGTDPSARPGQVGGIIWPRAPAPPGPIRALSTAVTIEEGERAIAYSFFYDDKDGRAAAKAYWQRIQRRNVSGEPLMLELLDKDTGAKRQMQAAFHWAEYNPENSWDRLGELEMPVLVANGDDDVLIPTDRSWELMRRIPNAQLVIYPRAGHGFLWQYAELFADHVNRFLDGEEFEKAESKL